MLYKIHSKDIYKKFCLKATEYTSSQEYIGEGNGNPLQYSCLENPMDRGAWWAAVHEVTEWDVTEQLSTAQWSVYCWVLDT